MAPVLGSSSSGQDPFRAETAPIATAPPDFIGKRVYAAEAALETDEYAGVQSGWNDIGEINDVVLTLDSKVDAVLVGIGGFRGLGERQVATDTSQLQTLQAIKGGDLRAYIQKTQDQLETLPAANM